MSIEHKSSDNNFCTQDLTQIGKKRGGGAFSRVFEHAQSRDIVIKAYSIKPHYADKETIDECKKAEDEYNIHSYIYDLFHQIQKDRNLELKIEIAKPKQFCPEKTGPYTIGNEKYKCFLVMSKLNGVSYGILKKVILHQPDWSKAVWDPNYLATFTDDHEIMVHPEFAATKTEFQAVNGKHVISEKNGMRGYVVNGKGYDFKKQNKISKKNGVLYNLEQIKKYPLDMNKNDIMELMGFVSGYMLFKGDLISTDTEFTLGLYGDKWKLNFLDFGQVHDLRVKVDPSQRLAFEGGYVSKEEIDDAFKEWETSDTSTKYSKLESLIKTYELSPYYSNRFKKDDAHFEKGWNAAKDVAANNKAVIKKRGHSLVDNGALMIHTDKKFTVHKSSDGGVSVHKKSVTDNNDYIAHDQHALAKCLLIKDANERQKCIYNVLNSSIKIDIGSPRSDWIDASSPQPLAMSSTPNTHAHKAHSMYGDHISRDDAINYKSSSSHINMGYNAYNTYNYDNEHLILLELGAISILLNIWICCICVFCIVCLFVYTLKRVKKKMNTTNNCSFYQDGMSKMEEDDKV